jgi:iron complex outermembrane receptor protein
MQLVARVVRSSRAVGLGLAATASTLALFASLAAAPARAQSIKDLDTMSLSDLANVDVTSVSKRTERLSDAPAAVYVITHDEIVRSGATSIPEILRLAPNLQVAVINASSYAITARGFNGNAADKLLVLIDGRSVYTPLFGGVQWDVQDVPPEDIERIEVISGPGATLWGANAVNGVINIITRDSREAAGGELDAEAGNREDRVSLQYGGPIANDLSARAYVESFDVPTDFNNLGVKEDDEWAKTQGGFRLDWTPKNDKVMVEGDLYSGAEQQLGGANGDISGGDIQANWNHWLSDGASIQLLSYYDETRQFTGPYGYSLDTYDIEFQNNFKIGGRQDFVWGAGYRVYWDRWVNIQPVVYLPASSTEYVADVFAQDTVHLTPALDLVLGMKAEKDPYSGVSGLPTARLAWKVTDKALIWAAASRAVRAPTLFDEDLNDAIIPSILILQGNKNFKPEKLTAYEVGARIQPSDKVNLSVSAYYNTYDDLRSTEWLRMTSLPLLWTWGNLMKGDTYGIEAWADYQPTDWWRLTAGLNLMKRNLGFAPGASALDSSTASAGDDPSSQAQLRSSLNLGHNVTWDADIRYVGALPNPAIPAYAEADTRLAWDITPKAQVSISGFNLLHSQHLEYEEAGATVGVEVQRSVLVGTKLKF